MIEVSVLNKKILFRKYESFWQASLSDVYPEATIEVYHKEMDITRVTKILSFVMSKDFNLFESRGKNLLYMLSNLFWNDEVKNPLFQLAGLTINDQDFGIDFKIFYHMSSSANDFQDFANWVVCVKDSRIVGIHREQL